MDAKVQMVSFLHIFNLFSILSLSLIGNPSRQYLESFQSIGFHPLPKLQFQAKTTGTCFLYE